jgi:hypothetical protein
LNGGRITLRNIKWTPGNATSAIDPFTSNPYGHGQFFIEMPAGGIKRLSIEKADVLGLTSPAKPLVLNGTIDELQVCGLNTERA